MAISKIILNGVTQMDLTSDTVQASTLIAPNTAHGADGTQITGIASSGIDVPVFTLTWDSNWATVTSVSCSKTFSECYSRGQLEEKYDAISIDTDGTIAYENGANYNLKYNTETGNEYILVTMSSSDGYPWQEVIFNSDGTFEWNYSTHVGQTLNVTTNGTYTPPWGNMYNNVVVNVPASGGTAVKTATGTFTGNGTRQVEISCNFEPDLIYWTSDPGTTASSGTVAGIIARGMMSANRYRNNSTSNSHYAVIDITDMNTGGSSYSFRATYANSTVTLYCFSSNARSLFTNGRTYTYQFLKWTT